MDRVEVRQLEYFIAVAEELHFSRAAERLGIAPPPLSRAIAGLERRLGTRLFERTSRHVDLTPAGKIFLVEARKALQAIDRAVHRTLHATSGALRIAVTPGTGSGLLRDIHRRYQACHGHDTVQIIFTRDQATAVRNGQADAALLCATENLRDLETSDIAQEYPLALLPAHHPLAARYDVSLACLRSDPAYLPECPVTGLDELIDRVALGQLVVVVGHSVTDRLGSAVVGVPVTGLPPTDLLLAWPAESRDRRIARILDLARTAMPSAPQPTTVRAETPAAS
ncbi:LysR family transcriptional regulator [Streptomyces sp. IB201691-2A2]|uniref:LysR family transcriptional regulator n=1 Tax=Streptomyces sp. IB201691-2A2 TaxID=2561920 RepID=UPI00117CF031|nr:LysR family transcriptional regulator [Streptomyces sp. IB201691-2A2]TRO55729.1 LysR family transcriptional regulator [Streptomyces sp. IB201691-2A2]